MALGSPKGGRGLRCAPQPSSGAVTGKREPRLNCIKRQSATIPGARASGETPPSAQANFGRGPTPGAVQKTVPAPYPCCGFVRLQTHSPWASKHSILSSLWNVPLQEGTQGPKEASPARGARSPRRPERRTCEAGVPPPGGCGHKRPTLHSPVRSPQRGGARAVGSCGTPHASSRTPTSLGRSRRRQLGHEPSPRALPRGREGSTHSAREEGGNAGPTVCRQGRAPTSVCGLPAAATAPATAIAAAAGAAATTASRPGTRRSLMLSPAAPPPLWASGAAKLLHIRGPAPAPPPVGGLGHAPFPSRDDVRRR